MALRLPGSPLPRPENRVAIERATSQRVRRWDPRPSDWHRIWPELIGAEGAPAVPVEEVRDAVNGSCLRTKARRAQRAALPALMP